MIPEIDLSLARSSEEDFLLLCSKVFDTYNGCGFGRIINHGISKDIIDNAFQSSKDFHNLSIEEKMKIEIDCTHRGFIPLNSSTLKSTSLGSSKKPNQTESFIIVDHEKEIKNDNFELLSGYNKWPKELDENFQNNILALKNEIKQLGFLMVKLFTKALNLENNALGKYFEEPTIFFRLLKYLPHPKNAPKDLYGSAPHCDYGFCTFVFEDSTGGLFVKNGESWTMVEPKPYSIILNVGEILQFLSNGKLKATPHYAINQSITCFRYSIAIFFDPTLDSIIENEETSEKLSYKKHLFNRIKNNHESVYKNLSI